MFNTVNTSENRRQTNSQAISTQQESSIKSSLPSYTTVKHQSTDFLKTKILTTIGTFSSQGNSTKYYVPAEKTSTEMLQTSASSTLATEITDIIVTSMLPTTFESLEISSEDVSTLTPNLALSSKTKELTKLPKMSTSKDVKPRSTYLPSQSSDISVQKSSTSGVKMTTTLSAAELREKISTLSTMVGYIDDVTEQINSIVNDNRKRSLSCESFVELVTSFESLADDTESIENITTLAANITDNTVESCSSTDKIKLEAFLVWK